jgi:hypothetical protein
MPANEICEVENIPRVNFKIITAYRNVSTPSNINNV